MKIAENKVAVALHPKGHGEIILSSSSWVAENKVAVTLSLRKPDKIKYSNKKLLTIHIAEAQRSQTRL